MTYDLFAVAEKRDEAIERAERTVVLSCGGDELVRRVIERVVNDFPIGATFTADVLCAYLDTAQVPRDQATRRRLISTITNRGRGKLWKPAGLTLSKDPRRNGRPLTIWERV